MKAKHQMNWLVAASLLLPGIQALGQTVLQSDDFEDGIIDPLLWSTDITSQFGYGGRSVIEVGGKIELKNKGYLVSKNQYDPVASGGFRISGIWEPQSNGDVLNVVIRANAIPTINYLNVDQGITCRVRVGTAGNEIAIDQLNGGGATAQATSPLTVQPGDFLAFEVVDDGASVTFTVVEIGGEGVNAQINAAIPTDYAVDYIVFHNRESNYTALLDDVIIESLASSPEDQIAATVERIDSLDLPQGLSNALTKKLENALSDLEAGDTEGAIEKITALINQLRAQSGKKVPANEAEALIEEAEAILETLA